MSHFWGIAGAVSAALAVALGAFAAHGLAKRFGEEYANSPAKIVAGHPIPAAHKALEDFKTGANYQFLHAFGMLFAGLYGSKAAAGRRAFQVAGWSFLLGTVLFSGSLYLLTLLQETKFGMVAPIGGTLLIIGWIALACGISKARNSQ